LPHIAALARQSGVVSAEPGEQPFAAFVRAHTRSLFTTAYLLTGDTGHAEELLQDTLVRLYPKWHRVTAAGSPVAYVRRSVVNGFISGRRRSDRVVAIDGLAGSPELSREGRIDPAYGVDVVADAVTDRQLLVHLMRELPARQQAALVLRYFDDLADAEIAEILGCRPATVRSLISRGLTAMRDGKPPSEPTGAISGRTRA
jgi:RNA polymerase sigma-70 factor (sigma-E family)